jgi:hypothetical protein
MIDTATTLTRGIYEGFQRVEFDRWDSLIAEDVVINSPAGYGMNGISLLKEWAANFTDIGYRIDLVDEHLALDDTRTGRGFITFCLYWKHVKDFLGMPPTGREGTSIETMLLAIEDGKVTRIDVASNTADLVLYEWARGWPVPHNVRPPALVQGEDRSASIARSMQEAQRMSTTAA